LKLGFTAFGGPAAHIAMFRDEVVVRRKWLDDQQFLDLLGAVNLIPGPNSTEMAIHISLLRAGWPGLILGGSSFIIPAMCIVLAFAWVYVRYGSLPQAEWLMLGVKPVVIAIIFQALLQLVPKAFKNPLTILAGITAVALYFLLDNPLAALLAGGLILLFGHILPRLWKANTDIAGLILVPALASAPFSLGVLFLTFLRTGAVLYGSGYVLLAFLRADLVENLGWLTDRQLLDAIAIGQVTPGPVFTTATFIGYLLGGVPGAILATLGIFLPSFLFVAFSNRLIPRMQNSPWTRSLLDGVNAASLGLMAAVTFELSQDTFRDLLSIPVALAAWVLLRRWKINTTWLIAGGALLGLLRFLVGGS
jgi:chromate transporter